MTAHSDITIEQKVKNVKKRFLQMYKDANAGHVGSSLSCAEILGIVKFAWMREGDEIILSKGHAAACLYSVLAEDGCISQEDISRFYKNGTTLPAHPPVGKYKEIPFATGSLGHGLPIAAGIGLANKLQRNNNKVFCVTSDGELNEGSTWEAALFISHHQLANVVWIIDRNGLQGFGHTEDIIKLEPLADKLEAFGFKVTGCDGNDLTSLQSAYEKNMDTKQPVAIIAGTKKKGNGWQEHEGMLACHYVPMSDNGFSGLISSLDQ